MSQAVLLRKMTEKSRINFGKFDGVDILTLLNLNKTRYLRWCYYNLSNITFTDEILDKIGAEIRIEKPGKNPKIGNDIDEQKDKKMNFKLKSHLNRVKRSKITDINKNENRNIINTKSSLQARNHGH